MPAQRTVKQPLYFVNPPVDFALIGGVSLITFAALKAFHSGERTEQIWTIASWLVWIVNWPHFSATSYRLYRSKENIRQYPITALVVPFLIITAVLGAFASPDEVAPWLVKLFLIWSPYHFSGQSLGISLIYARRAGIKIGRVERLALSGFIFSTFLVQTAGAESGRADTTFYSVAVPILELPSQVPLMLRAWMVACGAAVLYFAVRWSIQQKRIFPAIVLLPAITQFVWFVLGASMASFNEFVPFFHALQYLLIAWLMQLKESLGSRAESLSTRHIAFESSRWMLLNIAGGACLFWVLPRIGERAGFSLDFATPVILAAVQIHHFFVDGVIWKLKNPRVSSPLLANLGEMARPNDLPLRAA